ncbi:hypothetical protein RFI_19167, partial [Reticulomyxa filosa]
MFPPKNGPRAFARRFGLDEHCLPDVDMDDELTEDTMEQCRLQYSTQLTELYHMGYDDLRNMRSLIRHGGNLDKVMEEYITEIENGEVGIDIYIGDLVVRGPDWKWGDQDGKPGMKGIVRGLRQWHPKDKETHTTEVVVFWDIGLYGNYRFGYRGAYDVRVVQRWMKSQIAFAEVISLVPHVAIGDHVKRSKKHWRWGEF